MGFAAASASADVTYDEARDGDLASDGHPTPLGDSAVGVYSVRGSYINNWQIGWDPDSFSIQLLPGYAIQSVTVTMSSPNTPGGWSAAVSGPVAATLSPGEDGSFPLGSASMPLTEPGLYVFSVGGNAWYGTTYQFDIAVVSLGSGTLNILTLGTPVSVDAPATGDYFFKTDMPAGGHIDASLVGPPGSSVELYTLRGSIPYETPYATSYDARAVVSGSAGQSLRFPVAQAGTWYFMARVTSLPTPGNLALAVNFAEGIHYVWDEARDGDLASDGHPTPLGELGVGIHSVKGSYINNWQIGWDPDSFSIQLLPGYAIQSVTVTMSSPNTPGGWSAAVSGPVAATLSPGEDGSFPLGSASMPLTEPGLYVFSVGGNAWYGTTYQFDIKITPSGSGTLTPVTSGAPAVVNALAVGSQYFKMEVPAGGRIEASLLGPSGSSVELYALRGSIPYARSYDVRAVIPGRSSQSLLFPVAQAGTWYFTARVLALPTPGNLTLTVNFTEGIHTLYAEGPDLSNNGTAPTPLGDLSVGVNSVSGTYFSSGQIGSDPDYFSVNLVPGYAIKWIAVKMSNPNGQLGWSAAINSPISAVLSAGEDGTFPLALASMPLTEPGTYSFSVGGGAWYGTAYQFDITVVDLASGTLNLLTVGKPISTVAVTGENQYFNVAIPAGGHFDASLFAPPGSTVELYARRGSVPTAGTYDFRAVVPGSAGQSLLVPIAQAGTWYFMVHVSALPTPGDLTLTVNFSEGISLGSASPDHNGNAGIAAIEVAGAGFDSSARATLKNGDSSIPAIVTELLSSNRAVARFDLTGAAPGTWRLEVAQNGSAATLPFEIAASIGGPKLETSISAPAQIGLRSVATVWVEYKNTGDASMPAPLLEVYGEQDGRKGGILTLDSARLVPGFWTSAVPDGFSTSVQFLASGATPGLLQPGESRRIPVYYAGFRQSLIEPWFASSSPINFHLGVLQSTDMTPADWSSLKTGMRPDYVRADAWDAIWANFTSQIGVTWGDYLAALDRNAVYLDHIGVDTADTARLLGFDLRQADGLNPIRYIARGTDVAMAVPGLGLSFSRAFAHPISRRYELGPLGRGWAHEWQWSLSTGTDGTVRVTGMTGTPQIFQPDSRTGGATYFAAPGDPDVLTPISGGGFRLRKPDGIALVFRVDGNLDYVEDPNSNRITCGYVGGRLASLTHSAGQSLAIAYDGAGRIQTVTDSLARQTAFTYDASGEHLVQVQSFDGRITAYAYLAGQGAAREHALSQITYPGGSHQSFTYDAQGRVASTFADGNAGVVTFGYDQDGTVTATDGLGHSSRFYFDDFGQILKAVDPLGRAVLIALDDRRNVKSVTDPAGRSYAYDYDSRGNLTRITDPLSHFTRFTYTPDLSRLATLTDANNNLTQYGYDQRGNPTSIAYPDASVESWVPGATGLPDTWTNRRGHAVNLTWNAQARPTRKAYADGTHVEYTYNAKGNLVSTVDSTGTTTYTYDANEYLTRIDYPGGRWLAFTYDAAGRRATSLDQLGHRLTYGYDAPGRLSNVVDDASVAIVQYRYDAAGRLDRKDLGNGVYSTYEYDAAGQLLHLINLKPDGSVLSRFDYAYDVRGRRVSMGTIDGAWTYTYDETGQLVHAVFASTNPAVPSQDLAYEYDALGNRIRIVENGVTTVYISNNLNQYVQSGATTFQFDADGNLTKETSPAGITTYSYDDENRLIGVVRGTDSWTYAYDALGRRATTTANGATTRFLIDPIGLGNVVGEYDAAGDLIARYDHGRGLVSRKDTGGSTAYYAFDALGSTSELTGTGGSEINRYAYAPFASVVFKWESTPNPFQFVGEHGVVVANSKQLLMGARFYDAAVGRFATPDPMGLAGGDALFYRYCANQPITRSDPSGLNAVVDAACAIVGVQIARDRVAEYFNPWSVFVGHGPKWGYFARALVDRESLDPYQKLAYDHDTALYKLSLQGKSAFEFFDPQVWTVHSQLLRGFMDAVWSEIAGFCGWSKDPVNAPDVPTAPGGVAPVAIARPRDPNELVGPAGYGPQNYVRSDALLPYRIKFENDPAASAPAQHVGITNPLPAAADAGTFELTSLGFGDSVFAVPAGTQHWDHVEPMTYGGVDFEVHVEAGVRANGEVYATFQSIDPTTSLPPPVLVGFLPQEPPYDPSDPNAPAPGRGRGRGFVSYTVRPRTGLAGGTEIRNVASIVFDGQTAIATNQVDPHDASKGTDPNKEALVTILDAAPLVAPSNALLGAVAGRSYGTQTFSAGGGLAPFTWTVTGLPSGMFANVSGGTVTVTGTPSSPGSYLVSFGLQDAAGSSTTWTQTVVVRPATGAAPAAGQVTREYRVKIPLEPADLRQRSWRMTIAPRASSYDTFVVESRSADLLTISGTINLVGGGQYRFTNQRLTRTHVPDGARSALQLDVSATSTTNPNSGVRVWGTLNEKQFLGSFAFQSRTGGANSALQTVPPSWTCAMDLSTADFLCIDGGISFACDAAGAVHGVGSVRVPFGAKPRVPVTVSGRSGGTLTIAGAATVSGIEYAVEADCASWLPSTSGGEPSVLFGQAGATWSAQAAATHYEDRTVNGATSHVAVADWRVGAGISLTFDSPQPDVALLCVSGHDLSAAVSTTALTSGVISPSYLQNDCGPYLADALAAAGFATETTYFCDDGATRPADNAGGLDALIAKLQDVRRWQGGARTTQVVVVAHGHGGVWAHWVLQHEVLDVPVTALVDLDTNSCLWSALHGAADVNALHGVNPDHGETTDGQNHDVEDVIPTSVRNNLEVVPDRVSRLRDLFASHDPLRLDGIADASIPDIGAVALNLDQLFTYEADADRNVPKDSTVAPLPNYLRRETPDSDAGLYANTAQGGSMSVVRDWLLPLLSHGGQTPAVGGGTRWVVDAWGTIVRSLPTATGAWDGTDDAGNPVPAGMYYVVTPGTAAAGNPTQLRAANPVSRTPPMISVGVVPATTCRPQVVVRGTAASDVGVSAVTWTSDRGNSGAAVGSMSWSALVQLAEGTNALTFTVADAAGNTITAGVSVVSHAAQIHLKPGYNLVGLPSAPGDGFRASTLLETLNAGGASVSAVVDCSGGGVQTRLTTGSGSDFVVVPGRAYFVLSATAADVVVPGDVLPTTATVSLQSGLNYIALPISAGASRKVSALAADIASQGGHVTAIYQWKDGSPVPFLPGRSLNDFDIAVGQGFIVICSSRSTWTVYP